MRVLFVVQGEGRGHLTQAISLAQLLQDAGHQVVGAWVNVAEGRAIPSFFLEQFRGPVFGLAGPLLKYQTQTNALDLKATLVGIIQNAKNYRRSLAFLRDAIEEHQPDVVVNFFELLGGLTYAVYRPSIPMICIAHQCLGLHPSFPFPKRQLLNRLFFKALIRLNSWGASLLIGLSFDEQSDYPATKLRIAPPLLRRELVTRQRVEASNSDNFIVAYTTQPGLQSEILATHQQYPQVPITYFHPQTDQSEKRTDSLQIEPINGGTYLNAMQHCRAVMTTAGFESVCEALYLGKPVQMRPMSNHFEQACNALDGQRVGAGVATDQFDVAQLLDFTSQYDKLASDRFRQWYNRGTPYFVKILQQVVDQSIRTRPFINLTRSTGPFKPGVTNSF